MANDDDPHVLDDPTAWLLARFTGSPAIRRLARGLVPRFNCMRTDVPHSFGIHWTIGRKPWRNLANPGRSISQALWAIAWETLRLHLPATCADLEARALVTNGPRH
jgi:hypothetical protein